MATKNTPSKRDQKQPLKAGRKTAQSQSMKAPAAGKRKTGQK